MNRKVSHKVYEKLVQEKIEMKPRSYFRLISYLTRLFSLGFLFLAAIVFGFLFFLLSLASFNFFQVALFLVAGLGLTYISTRFYRRSKLCCRQEDWVLLIIFFIMAILLGAFLFNYGLVQSWQLF